jgi:hypothetical protein
MSNIDKQRIAAARTLEARSDAEFKTIADARHQLRAMQGGYRTSITWRPIEWTGVAIVWSAIAAVVATLALVLT